MVPKTILLAEYQSKLTVEDQLDLRQSFAACKLLSSLLVSCWLLQPFFTTQPT